MKKISLVSEKKIENFNPETNLTEIEINNFSHPIWLPEYFKYSQKYEVGNPFIFVLAGREYPFEIAGFYNSGLLSNNSRLKCVISEGDYQLLSEDWSEHNDIYSDGKKDSSQS